MDIEANINSAVEPKTLIKPFRIKEYQPIRSQESNEPWRFNNNSEQYHVCCGLLHIQFVIILLTLIKTCFVLWYATYVLMWSDGTAMFALTTIFGISLILSSYAFLVIGVIVKKYPLLIPYFVLSMFLILILVMKLFIDVSCLDLSLQFLNVKFFLFGETNFLNLQFLSTANTKNTLEPEQLRNIISQTVIIMIEIYSVYVVWRALNYITDYYMERDYIWNVKVADKRMRWKMEYTKDYDEYLRQREVEKDTDTENSATDQSDQAKDAEIFLKKHKNSQHSTTTSSDKSLL